MSLVQAHTSNSITSTTFSGEVLFRVRLTEANIAQVREAAASGLIYDGTSADLLNRIDLLAARIEERDAKKQPTTRLIEELALLQDLAFGE